MNAKRSSQEYDNISRGLIRGGTSVPLRGTPQESQQLQIWKRIISWERSNPTRTEDQAVLVKRGELVCVTNCFCRRLFYSFTVHLPNCLVYKLLFSAHLRPGCEVQQDYFA